MTPALALLATLLVAVATDQNRFASAYTQEGGAYRFPTGSNELHRAKYGDSRVDVATEADLRAAMEDPYIAEIWIRSDITLTNSRPLPALRNLRHLTMVGRCNYGWDEDIARGAGGARNPDAAKCVIDADGKSGIFEVYGPARLDLWDLSLTNGDVAGFGGAVEVTYGRLELNHCELRGNNATRGGAVSNWHGEVNVRDTSLANNTAVLAGAHVYHWGGLMKTAGSTIQGKKFLCNRAPASETYWDDDAGPGKPFP